MSPEYPIKGDLGEKGNKSAESRGKGISSRQEFVLPAKWESQTEELSSRESDAYDPDKDLKNERVYEVKCTKARLRV